MMSKETPVFEDIFQCTVGVDLFPSCVDIHGIVSIHVETVVLLSRGNVNK